jgi:hypothetical protein
MDCQENGEFLTSMEPRAHLLQIDPEMALRNLKTRGSLHEIQQFHDAPKKSKILRQFEQQGLCINEGVAQDALLSMSACRPLSQDELTKPTCALLN